MRSVRDRPSIGGGDGPDQTGGTARGLGHNGAVIAMSRERFEELVDAAFARIPKDLIGLLDNVVLFVEDDPPPGEPHLLGLYSGIPQTERGWSYGGALPDRIFVYRNPTLRICQTEEQVIEEVEITVAHEIAHHFGIGEERLHELGYG